MWEWEDPPEGDDGGAGSPGVDPAALEGIIESQRLELERRKQYKKIEIEINSAIDDRIARYKSVLELNRLEIQQLEEVAKNYQKSDDALKEASKKLDTLIAKEAEIEASSDLTRKQKKAQQKELQKLIEQAKQEKIIAEETQAIQSDFLQETGKELLKNTKLSGNLKTKIKKALEDNDAKALKQAMAEANAEFDLSINATQEVDKAFGFLANSVGMTANAAETGFGKMILGAATFGKVMMKDPLKGLRMIGEGFLGIISPVNIIGNGINFLISALKESEEAAASMTKAFGGGMSENMSLLQTQQVEMLRYNVSLGELAKSYNALNGSVAGFNKLLDKQKKTLATNATIASKFGVDQKALGVQTQRLAFAFGGLGSGTVKAQEKILKFAAGSRELGFTMQESVQMLGQFGGAVASMGGDITTELQKMQAMAKATGAEMNQLVNVARNFNTFKKGADFAAKLNSVFGTSISQIELMGMSMVDRNKAVAESLQNATGGYAAMTDHQRLAAAEMLGFGDDVVKLRGFMEGQTLAERQAAEARRKSAEDLNALKQVAMEMVPTLTQLANEFKAAFIQTGEFQKIIKTITDNRKEIIGTIKTLAGIVTFLVDKFEALIVVYAGLKTAQMAYAASQAKYLAMLAGGATAEVAASATKFTLGTAAKYAAGGMLAMVGILLALYAAYHLAGSPQLYEIAGFMAITVTALGTAFYFAGPAMMAALPALALVMVGLVAIFYLLPPIIEAIGGLVDSMTGLFTTMVDNVSSLYLVAGGLMAIGGAFFFLGNMALLATLGIFAGTVALVALRASMALSGTSFSDLMSIGQGVAAMGEGIKNLKEGISGLAGAGASLMAGLGDKSLMITGNAESTTVIAGKGGMFAFIPPKISVDVNMDDVKMAAPTVNVTVTLDGDELRYIISEEIAKSRG